MQKTIQLSLLMSAVAALSACGGGSDAPALPALACAALDPVADFDSSVYAGPCIAGAGATSSRTDLRLNGLGSAQEFTISYTDSSQCLGTRTYVGARYNLAYLGTTTVANLASDGSTPVTGQASKVEVSLASGTGTLATGTSATFALCKSQQSTATRNITPYYSTPSVSTITPTFAIRLSNPNTNTIAANPVFDNTAPLFYFYD